MRQMIIFATIKNISPIFMENNAIFIHPMADVLTSAIGTGTRIWQFSIILKGAILGRYCNINCHTFIENDVVLGDHVTLKSGVYLWDGIRIEDHVFIGPNATFVNNPYPRSQQYPEKHIGATIRKGASIGANATIMSNIEIGAYAMIGAGSVVTKNVPAYTVWYGNPARMQGYITSEGLLLDQNLVAIQTGDRFVLKDGIPVRLSDQ